jgi:hypothetical protein
MLGQVSLIFLCVEIVNKMGILLRNAMGQEEKDLGIIIITIKEIIPEIIVPSWFYDPMNIT